MKSNYLVMAFAIMFALHGSIAQQISTTETPSQESFQAGIAAGSTPSTTTPYQESFEVGIDQKSKSSIETPSQTTFAVGDSESAQITPPAQTTSRVVPTQMYNNISIANALKKGDALHILVANNGTIAADLANWKLVTDNRNLNFTFPIFALMPQAMVTIHTHNGTNTVSDLYGSNFMWNGTHEIKLLDDNGKLVYDYLIGTP
ncbi:MAG: lamin tail domain-containing protein [Methanotrichaceae archaeon]|nr:lamin tail domain-containing protein [Methanotrichaceae archaeon]